jgi:transposase
MVVRFPKAAGRGETLDDSTPPVPMKNTITNLPFVGKNHDGRMKELSFREFIKHFHTKEQCLDFLMDEYHSLHPHCYRCNAESRFRRVGNRTSYKCPKCKVHHYPQSGTFFAESKVSVEQIIYAFYRFHQSKNGLSASEIGRELGIGYTSALNLCHRIMKLMNERSDFNFSGTVMVDETYWGGTGKEKEIIFGILQWHGKVKLFHVPNPQKETIIPIIQKNVVKGSLIYSDEAGIYKCLPKLGYGHEWVNHSKFQWKNGSCTTQPLEGAWSALKRSLSGTHTAIKGKHLQGYLDQFCFSYNRRRGRGSVFHDLVERAIYRRDLWRC